MQLFVLVPCFKKVNKTYVLKGAQTVSYGAEWVQKVVCITGYVGFNQIVRCNVGLL